MSGFYETLAEAFTLLFESLLPREVLTERLKKFEESDVNVATLGVSALITFEGGDITKWSKVGEELVRLLKERGFEVSGSFKRRSKKVVKTKLMVNVRIVKGDEQNKVCVVFLLMSETREDHTDITSITACKPLILPTFQTSHGDVV